VIFPPFLFLFFVSLITQSCVRILFVFGGRHLSLFCQLLIPAYEEAKRNIRRARDNQVLYTVMFHQ